LTDGKGTLSILQLSKAAVCSKRVPPHSTSARGFIPAEWGQDVAGWPMSIQVRPDCGWSSLRSMLQVGDRSQPLHRGKERMWQRLPHDRKDRLSVEAQRCGLVEVMQVRFVKASPFAAAQ